MKPYCENGDITIYHGDCREVLPTLSTSGFDLMLADPPYGDTSLDWDERDLSWLSVGAPILQPSASVWCFGSLRMFMAQAGDLAQLGWRLAQDVVWEKHNGSSFHADRFKRVHEHVVQFYRTAATWESIYKHPIKTMDATARTLRRKRRPPHMGNLEEKGTGYDSRDGGPRLMTSVIFVPSCHGYAQHETQKPVGILLPLLEYSCPPGGAVIDPTMGVGSTLVAAKSLGRRAVGIEIQERYCEAAAKRLEQEVMTFSEPERKPAAEQTEMPLKATVG